MSIPTLPSDAAIRYVIRDDIMIGSANVRSTFGQATFGGVASDVAVTKGTFWTLSLKPASRGNLIWMKDFPAPAGNITRQFGPVDLKTAAYSS